MAAGVVFAEPLKAVEPSAVTQAFIEAARKEGRISFYTALELPTSERLGKAFEAKYPGIAVRIERSGAKPGLGCTYVPDDVSKYFPPEHVDPSGMHATLCSAGPVHLFS